MARRESYNPLLKSYPDSEKINALSEAAEVLYVRLIAASDDDGRYYGDAKWVLAKLFTARMIAGQVTAEDVESRLCELELVGLAFRYRVGDDTYLQLINVSKRIRNDVQKDTRFPAMTSGDGPATARDRADFAAPTEPNRDRTETETQPNRTRVTAGGFFKKLTKQDLEDDARLATWLSRAIEAGLMAAGERDQLRFFSAAAKGLSGCNPVGLFVATVRDQSWDRITQAEEQTAIARIKSLKDSRAGPPSSHAKQLAAALRPKD